MHHILIRFETLKCEDQSCCTLKQEVNSKNLLTPVRTCVVSGGTSHSMEKYST